MSDTHNQHRKVKVPDGDVLVHAGDITNNGDWDDLEDFNSWLGGLPHRRKLVIAGNHDLTLERSPNGTRRLITSALYLEDTGVRIDGVLFYGSPWSLWYGSYVFMKKPGKDIAEKWAMVPDGTDVLITHGPPFGYGDFMPHKGNLGCVDLLERVQSIKPKVHIFGHIHEGSGVSTDGVTKFVNAAICDGRQRVSNSPIVIDI